MASCAHAEFLLSQPAWALALAAIGLVAAARGAFAVVFSLYASFLRPAKPLRRRYGPWAVVTGATDGIGLAWAHRLAANGLDLILVGRNADKLREAADGVRSKRSSVKVETVVIDLAGDDLATGVTRLEEAIKGREVGVLVNNAGVSYPYARYLHEMDDQLLHSLLRVNVEALTRVTRAVLPGMVERRRGAIVNMGSGAATIIPSDPLYCVYAAAKAYVDQFSRSLYVEYKNKGIDVQCQVPLYVATKMSSIRKSSFFVPSPEAYVRVAIRYIGYEPRCTPWWPHMLVWWLLAFVPDVLFDRFRLGMCISIRKRGLAKDAKKKVQ